MKYMILILFIVLSAFLEDSYGKISALQVSNAQANRTISLITTHRTAPAVYLFESPVHKDDFLRLTSPYGYRELINPFTGGAQESIHKGIDILGTYRARITAIGAGEVVVHYPAPDGYFKGHDILGGMIKIDHGNGWSSVYGHLSASYVKEGQYVEAGAVIGRQGNTGKSYGSHIHFELQYNNETVQPLKFVNIEGVSE